MTRIVVSTETELLAAVDDASIRHIGVRGRMANLPTFRLAPGQALVGADPDSQLEFAGGANGVELSSDNKVSDLELTTDPDRCAVFNDTTVEQLGRIELRALRVSGVLRVLIADKVRGGHIEAHDVHIIAADARGFDERPKGFGVEVVTGAFTVWNQQADPAVTITADLIGISVGMSGAPVRGTGVFVGGAGS